MVSLKMENIQLLSTGAKEWKIKDLTRHKRDISVIVPDNADPGIILDTLRQ